MVTRILGLFEVFLGIFEKTKEKKDRVTLQPDMIEKLIPRALFHVIEMRFSKKIIPKTLFHVILRITHEYVICNFGGN